MTDPPLSNEKLIIHKQITHYLRTNDPSVDQQFMDKRITHYYQINNIVYHQ
jgi:hypothetical protein